MASDFDKFNEEVNKSKKSLEGMVNEQKKLEQGIGPMIKAYKELAEVNQEIARQQALLNQAKKFESEWTKKNGKELKDLESRSASLNKKEQERLKILLLEQKARGATVKQLEHQVELLEKGAAETRKMVDGASKLKAIANSTKNFAKAWGWDNLKKYGVFEMDKEIRNAARSMGIGSNSFQAFADNMGRAGGSTQAMGVSIKQLAVLQKGYSQEIGRSVALSERGLVAMAELTEGTGLGEQFAIGMAGAMDMFGGSVETTNKLIEETMNTADSMGVNSAKAAESMQKNLRFAQRYSFKNGVKGLSKMTSEALKLRLDLDGISGLADKVFRPEGAVELAAKLQTMGGAFAQMANPMQLMFKARNDFAGFAKDIGRATAEFVEYNNETGTFDIRGGLASDRMREIANMTGIGVEKLQEMASAQKRIQMIGSVAPISISDDDMSLVESMAEIGEDGKVTISIDGEVKDLSKLQEEDLRRIRKEDKKLKERAKQARTAFDVLDDLKKSFQGLLLPIAQGLKDGLKPLQDMMEDFNKGDGFYDSIRNFTKGIGSFIAKGANLLKPIAKFVEYIGPGGALAAIIGFKAATWIARGVNLGLGFNSVASVGGGSGGPVSGMMGKLGRNARYTRMGGGLSGKMGKFGRGMARGGMMKGGALALGGMAANVGRGFLDDPDSNLGKGLGVLGSTASYAGTGAMIGSVIPGLGTAAGAIIGGLLGAGKGIYDEYFTEEAIQARKRREGSTVKSGYSVDDGIIKFHPNDKFMQMNDGAILASTQEGQLHKAAKELSGGGDVNHKFDDIKIDININATGIDNDIANKIIDNKSFIRNLNIKIKEEASMVLSGGILNPTPK